ncbi:hypothetical protein PR003_g17384 [Phytophthora rubi]|nr:hypothetical protein PR002_g18139 [Phytophthora rubi]KAE9008746.1 hypothetical protein PR001_g16611 [Phytophthora rubi]KAE9321821.1 hypothetical protein PR003_g17384 [Phytophthora rubi]
MAESSLKEVAAGCAYHLPHAVHSHSAGPEVPAGPSHASVSRPGLTTGGQVPTPSDAAAAGISFCEHQLGRRMLHLSGPRLADPSNLLLSALSRRQSLAALSRYSELWLRPGRVSATRGSRRSPAHANDWRGGPSLGLEISAFCRTASFRFFSLRGSGNRAILPPLEADVGGFHDPVIRMDANKSASLNK